MHVDFQPKVPIAVNVNARGGRLCLDLGSSDDEIAVLPDKGAVPPLTILFDRPEDLIKLCDKIAAEGRRLLCDQANRTHWTAEEVLAREG
jgi:hypothetical protein